MISNFLNLIVILILINYTTYVVSDSFYRLTNYKLSQLKELIETNTCNTDIECPEGAECSKENHCYFNDGFICPGDDVDTCIFFNNTIWNHKLGKMNFEYRNIKQTPILEACEKSQVENKKCSTEKCIGDLSCISKSCYSGSCIANSTLYICLGEKITESNRNYVKCGKALHMKCSSDLECASNECKDGFCYYRPHRKPIEFLSPTHIIAMTVIAILVITVGLQIKNDSGPFGRFKKDDKKYINDKY